MKNFAKFLTILFAGLFLATAAYGQSDVASASATIYSALTITNVNDLNFGVIIPSGTAGDVTIDAAGAVTRTNNTAHPSSTTSTATFNVVGEPSKTYTIAINNPPITLTGPGANTMTISAIVSSPAEGAGTGTLSLAGTQTISVGGTLDVGANQAAGVYTNANAITVTINYN
ncbi:MAG TPA: DUF4402 domain-containing protein [Bacteroidales bacterium]|nr:DUF4402 domain-containing protein [Bacteroidales bacterium]